MLKHGWELTDDEIEVFYRSVGALGPYEYSPQHRLALAGIRALRRIKLSTKEALTVLDVGCGMGTLGKKLCEEYPHWEYKGIDPGLDQELGRIWIAPNGYITYGTAYQLPAQNDSIDLIMLIDVIEHLNRPNDLFAEVQRVLKSEGTLLLTAPNGSSFVGWHIWERLLPFKWAYSRLLPAEHPRRTWQPIDTLYSYDELQKLIQGNGFSTVYSSSTQFVPPFLSCAPLLGRVYQRFDLDRLATKILPRRLGYRLLFLAQQRVDHAVSSATWDQSKQITCL